MKWVRRAVAVVPLAFVLFGAVVALMLWLVRVEQDVSAPGEVRIERYQRVRAGQTGVITRLFVEPGERIEAGSPLVELRNPEAQLELRVLERERHQAATGLEGVGARLGMLQELHPRQLAGREGQIREMGLEIRRRAAEVAEAEHRRRSLEARLERIQKLFDAELVSFGELEEAQLNVRQEEERLRQIRLQGEEAEERGRSLEDSKRLLRSEQAQEVLELNLEGQMLEKRLAGLDAQLELLRAQQDALVLTAEIDGVVAGDSLPELLGRSVQRGEAIFSIVDSRSIVLETLVPEEAILHMRQGQSASVEIQGLPKQRFRTFTGQVKKIDPRPQEDASGARTLYAVRLSLDRPWVHWQGGRFYLRDGMRGRADIVYRPGVPLGRLIFEFLTGR